MQKKKHLHGLDLFKGSLIILVIVGHMVRGPLNGTLLRYVIYGFHMPLFIAITGFLIDYNKLKIINWMEIIKKYLYRVIIPWLFAVIVYFVLTSKNHQLKFFVDSFIHPFFHLWYIPGILSYIFIATFLAKLNVPFRIVLIISLFIGVAGYFAYLAPDSYSIFKSYLLFTIDGTLRPQFFIFFCLGMYLRLNQKILQHNIMLIVILALCSVSTYIYCFYHPNTMLSIGIFFILNILLVILMFRAATGDILPTVKSLEWIGVNSLPIYLWHVVPLLIIQSIPVINANHFLYYFTCIVSEICIIVIIKLLTNLKHFNKIIFGGTINNKY